MPSSLTASASPPSTALDAPLDADVRVAEQATEAGELIAARTRLQGAIARIDRQATLEDRMLAHALLGRIRERRGEIAKAREEYAKVLAAWTDPQAAVREITADAPDDPRSLRRLGRALTALGEARYFEAEQKRTAALRVTAPAFRGPATDSAVEQHFIKDVARYLSRRRALVEEAEAAYRSIVEIQPLPPPRWVVAAAERVAGLHEATATELEALPLPPAIAKSAAAKAAYQSTLREVVAPIRERAKLAYRACAGLAAKYRVEDEHSKRCEARLAELAPPVP